MVHRISPPPPLLVMMVFLLGFSHVLSSVLAVPTTRSLEAYGYGEHPSSVQDALVQDAMNLSDEADDDEVLVLVLEEAGGGNYVIEGRMAMESTVDYPGTGANNHHDPKTPARS